MVFYKMPFLKKIFYGISMGLLLLCFFSAGCAPLLVGAGAAGGYIIASDERTIGERFDDGAITTKVKSKLMADPKVKGLQIDVDTIEREVTLTGLVSSLEQAERAVELARTVKGVVKVKDNIKVRTK